MILECWVKPGSRSNSIALRADGSLAIRLIAIPEKGRANTFLLSYLAKSLGCAKGKLTFVSGQKARKKRINVDLPEGTVKALLNRLSADLPPKLAS
jgi:uncharacterized protein YggU (UPF0235/DUF167 family)